jgi:branched-chain amino acid transport system ATP-binding protein
MSLLSTHGLTSYYGDFQALYGLDLTFEKGDTVAIIGANGAGKSTFLRTITGLLKAAPDAVLFDGRPIGGLSPSAIMQRGIAMVPEGRKLFPSLTVEENLLIGADRRKGDGHWNLESLFALFPILKERRHSPGTALSGGQQQMVAIGRALMSNPALLLCDEISLGLAPVVIKDIYAALPRIKQSGTTVVIVEQDIVQALAVATKVYCLQEGRMTLSGAPSELTREAIQEAYFGH